MDHVAEIREFLTSRRAKISPQEAGLSTYGARRVPGLRRSEVAQLAGISVEYYSRLERGDLSGVSGQVLDLTDLIGELSTRSDDFRTRWARHDVRQRHQGTKPIRNPVVGTLHLTYESLDLPTDGLILFAYGTEPASESEDALRLLASWAADHDPNPSQLFHRQGG